MTRNLAVLSLAVLLLGGASLSQTAKQSADQEKFKTARVHIDGFMKSKSGAV